MRGRRRQRGRGLARAALLARARRTVYVQLAEDVAVAANDTLTAAGPSKSHQPNKAEVSFIRVASHARQKACDETASRCVRPKSMARQTLFSPLPSVSPVTPWMMLAISMSQYAGGAEKSKPSPFQT